MTNMTNIILLAKDRPRLTKQTLRTLYENTRGDQFNLTIVDDGSEGDTQLMLDQYMTWPKAPNNVQRIRLEHSIGIVGWLRNTGAAASQRYFGRGDWLCFIDNDIAVFPGWLGKMANTIPNDTPAVLGGYQHPFHGTNLDLGHAHLTDAVAGYMHFMSWSTWDTYGPYDQHAKGVCQSEDWAFCQKIHQAGGKVGYIHPPVIANCGLTNSEGKPAIGHESFIRYPGLIYE